MQEPKEISAKLAIASPVDYDARSLAWYWQWPPLYTFNESFGRMVHAETLPCQRHIVDLADVPNSFNSN